MNKGHDILPGKLDQGPSVTITADKTDLPLEFWTRNELYTHARDVGLKGRTRMDKGQLIRALKKH